MWALSEKMLKFRWSKYLDCSILGCAAVHSERCTNVLEESTVSFFCRLVHNTAKRLPIYTASHPRKLKLQLKT